MNYKSLVLVAVIGASLPFSNLQADVVLSDNFDRANGSLVGTVPTPGPGSVWANHSGNVGDLLIDSGRAVVQHGTPSEDANSNFGPVTGGILVATFDVTVEDDSPISGGDYEYFAHFREDGSFNFFSRLSIVEGTAGGDYTFGLSTDSGTEEAIFGTDFSFGQTVRGTLEYNFATGLASFSADGSTIVSTTVGTQGLLDSFALRQSDSSNNETIFVDNLVVQAIPEPGSLGIVAVVGLAALIKRRRG